MSTNNEIRPFTLSIPQPELDRLHSKLKNTRIPTEEIVDGAGTEYGISSTWVNHMYNYWLNNFSWRKAEEEINLYPHFDTTINRQNVHFVHAKSPRPGAMPILLIHGWPGSFYEFSQVMKPLLEPADEKQQAFHCVVPSLPGFCFTSRPPKGQSLKHVAGMFHELMVERLGYDQYVVQAGDWGQWCARELGANPKYAKHVTAMHLNWCPAPLPDYSNMDEKDISPRDQKIRERVQDWLVGHLAYAVFMRTRPSSLALMLQDNPTAILSFIGEKYDEVVNPDNPLVYTDRWKDHVLTTVCLYYFSNCSATASLVYFENIRHEKFPVEIVKPENRIRVPLAYTSFLFDTRPSIEWGVKQTGNLVLYKERDEAGHFAALECPVGLCEDLRALVEMVKNGEARPESMN